MSPDDNYDFRGLGEDVLEVWQYGSSSKLVLLRFEIYLNTPAEWTVLPPTFRMASEPFSGLDFTPAIEDTIALWVVTTEVQRVHARW